MKQRIQQLQLAEPIAIIGAGLTGQSCFRLLQYAGISATVFDEKNSLPEAFKDHADCVTTGAFHRDTFRDFGTVLLSPGVDTRRDCFAAVEEKLITDIELFARLTDKPIVGVTASNGKSTVVTLIHQTTQLAGKHYALCGNIGRPVLQALLEDDTKCDGYIVELSSYHLERAPSLKCAIGVWLNVSPDHLDRYDSYGHYVKTKAKLLQQSRALIVNADDPLIIAEISDDIKHCANRIDYFSRQSQTQEQVQATQKSNQWFFSGHHIYHHVREDAVFDLHDFPQIGNHHADNIMATFAVATQLGIDYQTIATACRAFQPLPSRAVVVGTQNGITFINDSKGTNIGATAASILGITRPIILIVGGQGKGQDFSELKTVATGRVKTAICFGEDGERIANALTPTITCQNASDLNEAVQRAVAVAVPEDVVLFSPACASFDMFANYLQRGEAFETQVKQLLAHPNGASDNTNDASGDEHA